MRTKHEYVFKIDKETFNSKSGVRYHTIERGEVETGVKDFSDNKEEAAKEIAREFAKDAALYCNDPEVIEYNNDEIHVSCKTRWGSSTSELREAAGESGDVLWVRELE